MNSQRTEREAHLRRVTRLEKQIAELKRTAASPSRIRTIQGKLIEARMPKKGGKPKKSDVLPDDDELESIIQEGLGIAMQEGPEVVAPEVVRPRSVVSEPQTKESFLKSEISGLRKQITEIQAQLNSIVGILESLRNTQDRIAVQLDKERARSFTPQASMPYVPAAPPPQLGSISGSPSIASGSGLSAFNI